MKSKLLIIIASLFLVSVMVFSTTLFQVVEPMPMQRLNPEEVRGMAAEKEGNFYTLNFSQQNLAITLINGMVEAEEPVGGEPLPTLHIYQFDQPESIVQVRKKGGVYLLFEKSWLTDQGQGEFERILKKAT